MTFETNAFKIEITMAYVTLETIISTVYMTFKTNVLSLRKINDPKKISKINKSTITFFFFFKSLPTLKIRFFSFLKKK